MLKWQITRLLPNSDKTVSIHMTKHCVIVLVHAQVTKDIHTDVHASNDVRIDDNALNDIRNDAQASLTNAP